MKTEIIDLYEYFNVKKPEGARGYLATYVAALSPEIDPGRKLPAMLVIPGGAYYMVSDREAEPVALKLFAAGFNGFVLNYSGEISLSDRGSGNGGRLSQNERRKVAY